MIDFLKNYNIAHTYDCGDDTVMYLLDNAGLSLFDEVCKKAGEAGYSKLDENTVDTLKSCTFRKDNLLHIYFSQSEKTIRVILDKYSGEYSLLPCEKGKFQNTLWQFEVDHSLIDCGMCYIIRCSDGSFFVIDSAHWYSVNDDRRLIEFMKTVSGEDKPRVSGWFFSHGHEDHIGRFNSLLSFYSSELRIDNVYYNFPSPAHWNSPANVPVINAMQDLRRLLSEHGEINHVKLHTGMRFAADNLLITVLCTHEDVHFAPKDDFNNTSTVISVEAAGTRILFPGDASSFSDKVMISRYSEALSCDIVQIAHHGHSGTSPEFYRRAGAKCALFPVTVIKFDEEFDRQESNRIAIETADEYYIASNGTVEIPLPYIFSNVKVHPDETFEDFEGIYNLWCYEYTDERKSQLYADFIKRRK